MRFARHSDGWSACVLGCGLLLGAYAGCGTLPDALLSDTSTKTMTVTSRSFADGAAIPIQHTGYGDNLSPELIWSGAPAGTQEFALIVDDPDAPGAEPFVHWVMYKIPSDAYGLVEGIPTVATFSDPAIPDMQGTSSFGTIGYAGPTPPSGTHHYHFKIYALDAALSLNPGATKSDLVAAMQGHVLAWGELVGTYTR